MTIQMSPRQYDLFRAICGAYEELDRPVLMSEALAWIERNTGKPDRSVLHQIQPLQLRRAVRSHNEGRRPAYVPLVPLSVARIARKTPSQGWPAAERCPWPAHAIFEDDPRAVKREPLFRRLPPARSGMSSSAAMCAEFGRSG